MFLHKKNASKAQKFLKATVDVGIRFKLRDLSLQNSLSQKAITKILAPPSRDGKNLHSVLKEFEDSFLPYCLNVSSPKFLGFPYAGNSVAALGGAILTDFLQQNVMSQEWAPSATFGEIAVIQWLRQIVGYRKTNVLNSVKDIGGIITYGGTTSNTVALLLARERRHHGTLIKGVTDPTQFKIVVPRSITHYGIIEAQKWIGCGSNIIEVDTNGFKMDLNDLKTKLQKEKRRIMCVIAFAGDAKTMSIDDLRGIASLTRDVDPNIWLHADASHGFSLAFSSQLRSKIVGIELFDSITADPHKVLGVPYPLSLLLLRTPSDLSLLMSQKVRRGEFSLSAVTPFVSSRAWLSLRLWFMLKHMGINGVARVIEKRYSLAKFLSDLVGESEDFVVIGEADATAVTFFYTGKDYERPFGRDGISSLNRLSFKIQSFLLQQGYYIARPRITDPGFMFRGAELRPLRYMCGNPNTRKRDLTEMVDLIRAKFG